MVEVPQIETQEIQTIVDIPDRQTLVVAGFRPKSRPGKAEEAAAAEQRLYVLVKPTLIAGR
jgi:hypothetical protein